MEKHIRFVCVSVALVLISSSKSFGEIRGFLPVFVSSTGYNSCAGDTTPNGTSLQKSMFELKDRVAGTMGINSQTLPWASSCFQANSRYGSNVIVTTSQPVSGTFLHEKVSYLSTMASLPPMVIVIGHSWGGMLAIETAIQTKDLLMQWSREPGFQYLAASKVVLVTLDAIDSHLCAQPVATTIGNPGCQGLPQSLFANQGALFQRALQNGPWLNFYQESGFLHSGPVPMIPGVLNRFPVENYRKQYVLTPHLRLPRDESVWDDLLAAFLGHGV